MKLPAPLNGELEAPAEPKRPVLVVADVLAVLPNGPVEGGFPVLLANREGVDDPEPGLDVAAAPPNKADGCVPPVLDPKERAGADVVPEPPKRLDVVGCDVAVDICPKGEEVLGVAEDPNNPVEPVCVVFDVCPNIPDPPLPPAAEVLKLNGLDIFSDCGGILTGCVVWSLKVRAPLWYTGREHKQSDESKTWPEWSFSYCELENEIFDAAHSQRVRAAFLVFALSSKA